MAIIIFIIIMTVCLASAIYCFVQAIKGFQKLNRNEDVLSYRLELIHRCSPDIGLMEKIVHKHTYEEMLQSSKPLEDSYWFTPEEIEKINSNHILTLLERA